MEGSAFTPPPLSSDPAWSLSDAGQWKAHTDFPVYAAQQSDGALIMQQLSLYSGNMTEAPNGTLLTGLFDSRSYVRLYCDVNTGNASTLPTLWVFLLIILGIVFGIIVLTSLLMHLVQSRRRQQLRRRISNGQVDLEALGIKRLKVPPQVLDQLPLFVYVAREQTVSVSDSEAAWGSASTSTIFEGPHLPGRDTLGDMIPPTEVRPPRRPNPKGNLPSPHTLPHLQLPYKQTTCPICLEGFVSHKTVVRKLPCPHIYHPECIDPMLQEYSSLCPYCKGKVLPVGYCPTKVTNNMVRLERNIRRIRERVTLESTPAVASPTHSGRSLALNGRMPSFHRQFGVGSRTNGSVAAAPVLARSNQSAAPVRVHRPTPMQYEEPPRVGLVDLDQERTDREAVRPRCKSHFGIVLSVGIDDDHSRAEGSRRTIPRLLVTPFLRAEPRLLPRCSIHRPVHPFPSMVTRGWEIKNLGTLVYHDDDWEDDRILILVSVFFHTS